MKKLIAALMALSLLLVSFAAFAEGTVAIPVDYNTMKDLAAKYDGVFATIANTGLMMYVPNSMKDVALTEEEKAKGLFLLLKSEDGKVIVNGTNYPVDANTFVEKAKEAGAQDPVLLALNDVEAYEQDVKDPATGNITTCIVLPGEENTSIVFTFCPTNDETVAEMLKLMAGSIQIIKE